MQIIAWDQLTDTAVEPERAPVAGEWARFTEGDRVAFKQYYPQPTVDPVDPVQLVSISALGELLPPAVRTEIRGYALDSGISAAKRQAASRIVKRINSEEQIDALGGELTTLLAQLVTHTVLTQTESDAILEALQS